MNTCGTTRRGEVPCPPIRPKTLNFQVNDVCNARCVMCHVWQHRRDREMSPPEFAALLADPYFSEVEHVGITGGEPTLRRDLAEFYLALPDVLPRLTGASFITHGMDTDRALVTYTRVAEAYRERGLQLHGMVSLDGLDAVHDRVRGRAGAFARATRTLFGLKAAGVPAIACCTIVRSNVWGLQDLLEWGYDKTYIRFRVAEFINRLSNHTAVGEIRAFDAAERSTLISFFQHLILHYEQDESVRRTYASIMALLAGQTRQTGCPYQDGRAINLDCRGRFAVCAPKGTPHPLDGDAAAAVAAAARERQTIVDRHCARCIHDYHDDWRPSIAERRRSTAQVVKRLEAPPPVSAAVPSAAASPRTVLVLGWYGTETIGDMAILSAVVDEYRRNDARTTFIVPSQFPDYTRHNLFRLGLDCRVESYGDPELVGQLWGAGTVVIGGGPLMDVPQLAWIATIIERARALGRRTVIEGCGIGPVHLASTAGQIRRIAAAADDVRLRDHASARALEALGIVRPVTVVEDPAARWVRSTGVRHSGAGDGPVSIFARALTHEYPQHTSPEDATLAVAGFVRRLCDGYPDRAVRLHAMHYFPVGGDDRVYARRLAALVDRAACTVDQVPRTPLEALQIMACSSLVVCMRFHSLVFAHGIGAPLLAIDYTDGGKVAGYVQEHGLDRRMLTFAQLRSADRSIGHDAAGLLAVR